MSNHHLRNKELTLKAKELLSQMLSFPEDWDYTLAGLSQINRESIDAIRTAVWELEKAGYITRRQGRDEKEWWYKDPPGGATVRRPFPGPRRVRAAPMRSKPPVSATVWNRHTKKSIPRRNAERKIFNFRLQHLWDFHNAKVLCYFRFAVGVFYHEYSQNLYAVRLPQHSKFGKGYIWIIAGATFY